jgi:hypothetical protein
MKRHGMLAFLLVTFVLPTSVVWAQQVNACVKDKQGQIRIVAPGEACLPSEHLVQWGTSSGSGLPAANPALNPLRVVDSNGGLLGFYAGPGGSVRQAGDVWVTIPAASSGFQFSDLSALMLFYQTTDCSGDPFLPIDTANLARTGLTIREQDGRTNFYYPSSFEVAGATIQAYERYDGATWTCSPIAAPAWMPLFGRMASIDLTGFQAPFRIVQ